MVGYQRSIGFVGGTFGNRGGQNMIEPAAYGVATCFGPNTRNFRDIVGQLLTAEAAEVVQDPAALATFVRRALEDARWAPRAGQGARASLSLRSKVPRCVRSNCWSRWWKGLLGTGKSAAA